jgi:hypothetical protein
VFRLYPGMVVRRFPGCEHEYTTYDPSDPPPPSSAIKMPPRFQVDRSALEERAKRFAEQRNGHEGYAHDYSPQDRRPRDYGHDQYGGDRRPADGREDRPPRKRSLDANSENDGGTRHHKRSRWSQSRRDRSRENDGRAPSPRRLSPSLPKINLDADPWSPQAGETSVKTSSGDHRPRDSYNETPTREERVSYSDKRHDSGYHSGQSLDKITLQNRDDERGRRPSDRPRRRRSPSRSRSRGRSRASLPNRNDRSRSRSESPLTPLEAELLGLAGESSDSEPKPVAKKPIKKRVKVAAAFE